MDDTLETYSNLIRQKALELGFTACGISQVRSFDEEHEHLQKWLDSGYHGSMAYMARNSEKRLNTALLFKDAKSVISVLLNYYSDIKQKDPRAPIVSSYAYGKDYHLILKKKLIRLFDFIQSLLSDCNGRCFVDTAPLLEKKIAVEAGLGWIGKNSLLITPRKGSFHFIGEIVIDKVLDYNIPFEANNCGTCSKCIDSCPTKAIVAPAILDAKKCISYLTLETHEEIPEDLKGKLAGRIVGCDICQDVCPWNKKSIRNNIIEFSPTDLFLEMGLKEWKDLDYSAYENIFKNTAVERSGYQRIKKNFNYLYPEH